MQMKAIAGNILPYPEAIIFDWDNTLVSNWLAIYNAYNLTADSMGMPDKKITLADEYVMGAALKDQFPIRFGERWREAREQFYAHFERTHIDSLKPFEGSFLFLQSLAAKQIPLFIVSNKTGKYLRAECEHLGWAPLFSAIIGAGDAPEDKPHAAPVHMALSQSGLMASDKMWFIGDMEVDVICAKNAGVTSVLVRDKPYDGKEKPHFMAESIQEIEKYFHISF